MSWRHGAGWLLASFLLLDLFVLVFGDIAYGTKDDVRIMQLLSGTLLCDRPSAFIMYPNILLGKFLKSLYLLNGAVPWYFLFLSGLLVVVHLLFVYVAVCFRGVFIALVVGTFFYIFFYRITFTETAVLLSLAGFVVLYLLVDKFEKATWGMLAGYAIAALFFTAGVLVRPEAFFYASVFGLMFLVLAVGFGTFFKRVAPFYVLAVAMAVSLPAYDIACYNASSQNSEFAEYNKYKTYIVDFDVGEHAKNFDEALQKARWSRNDYEVFHHWLFLKNEVFSLERLRRFVETLDVEVDFKKASLVTFYRGFLTDPYVILAFMMLLLLGTSVRNTKGVAKAVWWLAYLNLVFVFVTIVMKMPPPRLYLPAVYFSLVAFVLQVKNVRIGPIQRVGSVVLAVLLLFLFNKVGAKNRILKDTHRAFVATLNEKTFYLSVDDALVPMGIDPRSDMAYLKNYKVVPFGTVMLLGEVRSFLIKHGLKDYINLANGSINILFPIKSLWKVDLLEKYIWEHDNIRIRSKREAKQLYNDFVVLQLSKII